jgi:A/G-specific adenine glycosylase
MKADIQEILRWYAVNKRVLPWRKTDISAYEVWVSEIMLQQTQVPRVILYYERFLKKFPTVQKLSYAGWEEFLPYYEGLGYYARGRNMLKTAEIITRDFDGKFPKDKKTLMKLPGIGEYTASAILSFAFRAPEIAFDTNFRKIFGTRRKAQLAFKKSGVPSNVFNGAVMDYASPHTSRKKSSPLLASRGLPVRRLASTPKRAVRAVNQIVALHENHKKYFSENKKKYAPFAMPKYITSREAIKKYFLEKYELRTSVRPPNKRGIINVQILLGSPRFAIYSKKDYHAYYEEEKSFPYYGR